MQHSEIDAGVTGRLSTAAFATSSYASRAMLAALLSMTFMGWMYL